MNFWILKDWNPYEFQGSDFFYILPSFPIDLDIFLVDGNIRGIFPGLLRGRSVVASLCVPDASRCRFYGERTTVQR